MTNTDLLLSLIREKGLKITYIATQCDLSYPGFMNKARNKNEFFASEIVKLSNLLALSPDERDKIFFAADVNK